VSASLPHVQYVRLRKTEGSRFLDPSQNRGGCQQEKIVWTIHDAQHGDSIPWKHGGMEDSWSLEESR